MSFNNVFGGRALSPSDVGYNSYDLTSSITLTWPKDSVPNPSAEILHVACNGGPYTITVPYANEVSQGQSILFRNTGNTDFNVLDAGGGTIATVRAGRAVYLYIVDNSTPAGGWGSLILGVGSSSLDAASLQGLGLIALGATLNQGHSTSLLSSSSPVGADYRASVIVWGGGLGTLSLPATSAAGIGNTFFFEVRNQGTGVLTIASNGSEKIDDSSSIQLQPGDSCFVHAGLPPNWYTVGRGRSAQFSFTQLVKQVDGGSDTLTPTEAANVVQKYVGVLASDQAIIVPQVVQVYYVSNATSGAFALTVKTAVTNATTVTIPANQNAILFCDGTNVVNASTTIAGFSSLILSQGSATTPPLAFTGNLTTGIFQPLTGTVGVTCAGVEMARFTSAGITATTPLLNDTSSKLVSSSWVRSQGYISVDALTGNDITHALGYTPLSLNGGTLEGPLVVNHGVQSVDGLVVYNGASGATAINIVGRPSDNVGALRWVSGNYGAELSGITENGNGSLTVRHGGAPSASFAGNGVTITPQLTARVGVQIGGATAAGVTFAQANIPRLSWGLATDGSGLSLYGYNDAGTAVALSVMDVDRQSGGIFVNYGIRVRNNVGGGAGGQIILNNPNLSSGNYEIALRLNGQGNFEVTNKNATASNLVVTDSGELHMRGTIFAGSDARWKTNRRKITKVEALHALSLLSAEFYDMHERPSVGLIAQDVLNVPEFGPRVVTREPSGGWHHLDYQSLLAGVVIPSVQALMEHYSALEDRIEKLEKALD